MWDGIVGELAGSLRCITWDERGHGQSDCHGVYTFWDLADDAAAVLDLLDVERAVMVGLSQGGFLSMRFAHRYPERTAGLVLIDTKAALDADEVQAGYRAWGDAWTTEGPTDELASQMAALQFGPDYDATSWILRWRSRPPMSTRDQWTSVVDGRDDMSTLLDEIRCPAMVIVGEHDGAFPPADAEQLAAGLPGSGPAIVIDGAHHAAPVTHPHEIASEILAFTNRITV
jgi:pimeloyl-ACP methyl ester carboxylesterase